MVVPLWRPTNAAAAEDIALFFADKRHILRHLRRLLRRAVWILIVFLLALLAVGCKKPVPANPESAATPASGNPNAANPPAQAGGSAPISGKDQPGSLADRLNAIQSGPPPDKSKQALLPDWKPVDSNTSSINIPLIPGLVVDGVISGKFGDLESVRTFQDVNGKTVTMVLSGDVIVQMPNANSTAAPVTKKASATRILDVVDLADSHHLMHMLAIGKTEHIPGSTAVSSSTEVLNQLRAGQSAQFDIQADVVDMLSQQLTGHPTLSEALIYWNGRSMYKCSLQRVEPADLAVPVLVNDVRVQLPAVHAKCDLTKDDQAHFYILDQPSNPLLLATQVGAFEARSQVIKITFPQDIGNAGNGSGANAKGGNGSGAKSSMENDLAQKKPVEIYGIYFDFDSAEIKPESEAVLKQIAGIMQRNPDWKLSVSGHTDNIGDANFNLGLSQRRAAAVKSALVTRYKIAPDRLITNGYGASQPIETNTTMEGRARNRRVELQRQ
jgi:outer membrane protein OmpA-like peptidoglycan-associated protein